MAAKDESDAGIGADEEYVPAAFARCHEEAELYLELLRDHDIPALISDEVEAESEDDEAPPPRPGITHGVAVLVPESLLDEAGIVVAEQDDLDEFAKDEEDDEEEDDDDDFSLDGFVEEEVDSDDLFDDEDPLSDDDDEF